MSKAQPTRSQEPIRPLFLLSQMRSGSTVVQRVLASHTRVATAAEPWLLLPLTYMRRKAGARAEYWHVATAEAIDDFCWAALPGRDDDWQEGLRTFVLDLYRKAAGADATYFLDKTPHYHFIASDIQRLFPEAKLVFLWRNPLAVIASSLETFRGGRFEPYLFKPDALDAIGHLVDAREAAGDRAHAVRYEDLFGPDGEQYWRSLFTYLELDWEPGVLTDFSGVQLQGRYGDPVGRHLYQSLSSEPLEKWKKTFSGAVRRRWAKHALRRIGAGRLHAMGYDPRELQGALDELRDGGHRADRDAALLALSAVRYLLRSRTLRLDETPPPIPRA